MYMCILYTRTHTDMPRISPHVYFIYMYMCMCMCSLYICTCVLYTRLQIPMCRELHVHVSSTKVHMYMCINYTCTFYTHVRIPISRDSVQLDSSDSPAVSFRPLGLHPSTPHAVCVCECAYTHMYRPIYSHPHQQYRKYRQHPYRSFYKKITFHASNNICIYMYIYINVYMYVYTCLCI